MIKLIIPAVMMGGCFTALGIFLDSQKIIEHPAYWASYGFAWGVAWMLYTPRD